MNDIVVFSETWEQQLVNLETVLQRLRESKFFVKRSKCEFASEEIDLVGFRVSASGTNSAKKDRTIDEITDTKRCR